MQIKELLYIQGILCYNLVNGKTNKVCQIGQKLSILESYNNLFSERKY